MDDSVLGWQDESSGTSILANVQVLASLRIDHEDRREWFAGSNDVLGPLPIGIKANLNDVRQVGFGDPHQDFQKSWLDDLVAIRDNDVRCSSRAHLVKNRTTMGSVVSPVAQDHFCSGPLTYLEGGLPVSRFTFTIGKATDKKHARQLRDTSERRV
jgi:hypothetical protein